MACPSTSSPRPGAPDGFWLTLQGVLSFLPSSLNGWLAWTPDWLDGAYVSTAQLCAAPQPVVGAFPAADYLACQLSPLTQYGASCAVVRSWFNTFVRSLLWANQCQCDAVGGACSVTWPSQAGLDQFNPNAVNIQDTGVQTSITNVFATVAGADQNCSANFRLYIDCINAAGATIGAVNLGVSYTHNQFITVSLTPLAGTVRAVLKGVSTGASGCHYIFTLTGGGYSGTCPGSPTYLPAPTTPAQPSGIVAIPSGSCATTADLCAELLRLEQYVSELTATANYLTRQLAPYSYIMSTPSSGLSGTGYIAVTECLGVLVTLTTIPGTKGAQSGTPTRHFDVGRINWGDVNGYHAHYPIHESPELIMGIPNTATRIGYTFPAGVVATITPIKRT